MTPVSGIFEKLKKNKRKTGEVIQLWEQLIACPVIFGTVSSAGLTP